MLRPRRSKHARGHRRIGHQRRRFGHVVADFPHAFDIGVIGFAEVVPDGRRWRDHVRLIAAEGDDRVRSLLNTQVLAAIVPADVHQHRGVERAAAAPRRSRRVRALTLEGVIDRDESVARAVSPVHPPVAADVREDDDIGVFEVAVADVIGLGGQELFGNPRPELDRALDLLALHDSLQHDGRRDIERHPRVVTLAVAGAAFEKRIVVGHARLLRSRRNAVDVGAQRDDRLARSPRGHPRRRDARNAFFDGEALLPQDVGQVFGGFDLLESELAEAEDGIHHLLCEVLKIVHARRPFALERAEPRFSFRIDSARRSRGGGRRGLLRMDVDNRNRGDDAGNNT